MAPRRVVSIRSPRTEGPKAWGPASQRLHRSRPRVELVDHLVPDRDDLPHLAPKALRSPGIEFLQRNALLFHPREIAQIKDPSAVRLVQPPAKVGPRPQALP